VVCDDENNQAVTNDAFDVLHYIASKRLSVGKLTVYHPEGRKAVFLGDLVDRGTRILDTVKLVHNMVAAGTGICVPGNHENKLLRLRY
jgi:hypothetical protein